MAKTSGIGWTKLEVDDAGGTAHELKDDVLSLDLSTPRANFDVTGLDKAAIERILGLADATVSLTMAFNPAEDKQHAVFRTASSGSTSRTVSLEHSSQTLVLETLITKYDLKRGKDGGLEPSSELVLSDGTAPTWGP